MKGIRLDTKDERILNELDKDATIPVSSLADNVGVSRQTARYRLDTLSEQNTIYDVHTMVDPGRLGYSSYRIHIRLQNVDEADYYAFAKELFEEHPAFWVAYVSGSFDIIVDIFARTANRFEERLQHIVSDNEDIIQSYETMVVYEMNLYDYGYFLNTDTENDVVTMHRNEDAVEIDDLDHELLEALNHDGRTSYRELGRRTSCSRNTAKNRVDDLEDNGVIAGYKAFVNFDHFDKVSSKVFIEYDSSHVDEEEKLLSFLRTRPGVLASLKLLGEWDLDIEIHTDTIRELQEFLMRLRNKFDLVHDYAFIQIIEDYGISFYPDGLHSN